MKLAWVVAATVCGLSGPALAQNWVLFSESGGERQYVNRADRTRVDSNRSRTWLLVDSPAGDGYRSKLLLVEFNCSASERSRTVLQIDYMSDAMGKGRPIKQETLSPPDRRYLRDGSPEIAAYKPICFEHALGEMDRIGRKR